MILNIYKSAGMTSHDVVDEIRRVTGERRVGHGGTLDPFAEGVLVVGVGRESTKKLGNVLKNTKKEYEATLEFGKTSSTGDVEGALRYYNNYNDCDIKESIDRLKREEVVDVLEGFVGEIEQKPPAYSAIKVRGVPAYKLARKGEKVDLPKRKVQIYELEIMDFDPPFLKIRVVCSSGTYIRSLAEDIGKTLDVGAYLTELVRTRVGDYRIEDSIRFQSGDCPRFALL